MAVEIDLSTPEIRAMVRTRRPVEEVIDVTAIEQAVKGRHVRLGRYERFLAIDLLDDGTRSASMIAQKIGCSKRAVGRRRVKAGRAGQYRTPRREV